jgi:hypothetical protein
MAEHAPLPLIAQWSESRGFVRLYHNNPHYQARLAMHLCGLRGELADRNPGHEDDETVKVIDGAIREFATLHPEFLSPQAEDDSDPELRLGPYEPDPLLLEYIERITR